MFGCTAYVHVPAEKRRKLDVKSIKCIFIGYPDGSKGYKFYCPEQRKMLRSRDVVFMEDDFMNRCAKKEQPEDVLDDTWLSDKLRSSEIHAERKNEVHISLENTDNFEEDAVEDAPVIEEADILPQRRC